MTDEISATDKLNFNYLMDLKKRQIDKFERATIVKTYMTKHKLTGRALAHRLGIPKSTIEDWLLFGKLEQVEYKEMKKTGLSDTDIYRSLRDRKKDSAKEIANETKLDYELKKAINKLNPLINKVVKSDDTQQLIKDLQNILNRILMRVEKDK